MPQPIRILYLDYTNGIGAGGGQRSLALLLKHLPRERYQPVLACPPGEKLTAMIPGDVPVEPLRLGKRFAGLNRDEVTWLRLPAALAGGLSAVRDLDRIIRRQRVDLIHANNLKMLGLAAASRLPVIWHVRDIFTGRGATRRLLGAGCRLAARVLAVSQAVASHLPSQAKVEVLYNAVELPRLDSGEDLRTQLGITAEAWVIGYVGRLERLKGLGTLLAAFGRVHRSHPNTRLLVAGDGPEAAEIRGPGVIRLPFQNSVGPLYRTIDIAVQPSTEPDAFPRSVIEAMSYARPVVGANAGGIAEAIDAPRTGLLHAPGDADGLADALLRLAANPALAAGMGRQGRRRAETRFSVDSQIRRLVEIYDSVLAAGKSRLVA